MIVLFQEIKDKLENISMRQETVKKNPDCKKQSNIT